MLEPVRGIPRGGVDGERHLLEEGRQEQGRVRVPQKPRNRPRSGQPAGINHTRLFPLRPSRW
jgi:hypothetical protein